MAQIYADRVKETTTTTGTGTLSLGGAAAQFQSFVSGIGSGNTTDYCIVASDGASWEVGNGTVTSGSPNTLSRTTVYASSNSGNLITLPSGTHTVFGDCSAYRLSRGGLFQPVMSLVPTTARTGLATTLGTGASLANYPGGVLISGSASCGAYTSSVPATPYSISVALAGVSSVSAGISPSLGWTNGTAIQVIYVYAASSGVNGNLSVQTNTDINTFGSTQTNIASGVGILPNLCFFKIRDDGTNVYFYFGADFNNWVLNYSVAKTSGSLGSGGYSHIFVGNLSGNGTQNVSVLAWTQGTS
jgi:hypothetical protein